MIKYRSAYNTNRDIVCIDSLSKESRKREDKYICISCEKELIPKLGKIRIKHFSHKKEVLCSSETYLHKLGKLMFYNEYSKCKRENNPFNIELEQKIFCNNREKEFKKVCYIDKKSVTINLLDYFPLIKMEKRIGLYIPDLLLSDYNGNINLFFEIVVTHRSSESKINSSNKIIELWIEEEKDLEVIYKHCFSFNEPKIKFINFKINDNIGDHCGNVCKINYHYFVISKEGRCIPYIKSLSEISYHRIKYKDQIVYDNISEDKGYINVKYKYLIAKKFQDGINIKNCFICKYHGFDDESNDDKPIKCNITKEKSNSNKAVSCLKFKADKFYIDKYIDDGKYYFNNT